MKYAIKFFRIAARFLGVGRIDLYEIAEILRNLGYTITVRLPPKGFKVSIGGSGPVAVKGNIIIDINSDKMIIGVSSPDPESCINEFITIEKAVASSIEILKEAYFYELLAEIEVKTDMDPMNLLRKISPNNIVVQELSRALGEPLYVFGYRLTREGASPEEREWIDVEIVPNLGKRPHSSLYIAFVYRSKELEKVIEIGKKLESLIHAVDNFISTVKR